MPARPIPSPLRQPPEGSITILGAAVYFPGSTVPSSDAVNAVVDWLVSQGLIEAEYSVIHDEWTLRGTEKGGVHVGGA